MGFFIVPLLVWLSWLSASTFGLIFGERILRSRRDSLASVGFGLLSSAAFAQSSPANAFANKISNAYDDRPKRRGVQPNDLGVAIRTTLEGDDYLGLKPCGAAPNCFSSSTTVEEDPDHSIPAWKYPASYDQKQAFDELKAVIEAYPPGQSGVDGGGFEIETFDPTKGYMYVQFEALKNGYIDDFEAAVIGGNRSVQVRSSSRVGYLDFGVNAKRLNYVATELRRKGWEAEGVDFKTHRRYAIENEVQ